MDTMTALEMMLWAVAVLVIFGFSGKLNRWMWSKSERLEERRAHRKLVAGIEKLPDAEHPQQTWNRDYEEAMELAGVSCTRCRRGRFSGNLWADPECPRHGHQTEAWWSHRLE